MPFDDVVTGYHLAAVEAAELGIDADLIMCFLRDHSAESAARTLEASLPFQDWIIGVGLDSDERGNPPEKFAAVFAHARELGYKLTMHCDIDQVGSIDNIRTVLRGDPHRPHRPRHERRRGPGARRRAARPRHRTHLLPDLQPLRHRRHEGAPRSPNCCVPAFGSRSTPTTPPTSAGMSSTTTWRSPSRRGLSSDDIVTLAENSFAISWVDDDRRAGYLDEVARYVAEFSG